jgi:hypothetical protein
MSTATASLAEPVHIGPTWQRGPDGKFVLPQRTLGWQALQWTATYLRQPDGPDAGTSWRYTNEQARFLLWWYALDEAGRFTYRRGMLRRMKGWGKDPFGATWCAIELCGPCRFGGWDAAGEPVAIPHPAPWVITAAVSLDQTKNTMRLFPGLFTDDAIDEYRIDIGKEIIYTAAGLLEAVTSSPRALEGKRTTAALKNEPHHWLETNDGLEMAKVIARNNAKARGGDARDLSISNAHNPGEGSDAEPEGLAVDVEEDVRAALVAARGDSVWLNLDGLTATILDPKTGEGESRRFYYNQIHAGDDVWLKRSAWDAHKVPREIEKGTPICVGFDGSDTDDWTALRAETRDGYQFTPRFADGKLMIWDPGQHDGYTPRAEVNAAVDELFARFKVIRFYADPPYWQSEIDAWAARYGDKVVFRWATYRIRQMAEALERFRTDVHAGHVTHDGCPITSKHVENAHADRRPAGLLIRKDKTVSKNKIDAVMSSALAREAAFDATVAGLWPKGRRKLIVMR